MIMRFSIPYDKRERLKTDDVLWEKFKAIVEISDDDRSSLYSDFEGDIEKVIDLIGPIEVTGKITPFFLNQFQEIAHRMKNLESAHAKIMDENVSFNQRVGVHVPGLGLLRMKTVQVVEDACTEKINDYLQKGWRIVAVCPQPDSRRPDYILGHHKKGEEL